MGDDLDYTWQGWLIFSGYLTAALICGWHGWGKSLKLPKGEACQWKFLAILLLFLGLNKQLDLQTLMICIGRTLAREQGWMEYRRQVQLLFAVGFAGLVGVVIIWCVGKGWGFYRSHRCLTAGVGLILFYVVIRAADIDHVFESRDWQKGLDQWFWIVELTGTVLAVLGALRWKVGGIHASTETQ